MQPKTYQAKNGRTVVSELTLAEAVAICQRSRNEFANELAAKAERFAPSTEQTAWLHILAQEQLTREQTNARVPTAGLQAIQSLFDQALDRGLKSPLIRIAAHAHQVLLLKRAAQGKYPGAINIKDNKNNWYGRIHSDGHPDLTRDVPEWVIALLQAFAADPAGVASTYGRLTGRCSFCARDLSDTRSIEVGYGPICAERYGLPWGTAPDAPAPTPA